MRARRVALFVAAVLVALATPSPTTSLAADTLRAGSVLVAQIPSQIHGTADWRGRIADLVRGKPFSVTIGNDGEFWYRYRGGVSRPPASNQKLLLSMALVKRVPLDRTIATRAMSTAEPVNGVLHGDLWIVGGGDPETAFGAISDLADELRAAGLTRIRGRVIGATTPFIRDWWAPGWRDYFPSVYIQIPTALTFRGNEGPSGRHIRDPERRAARELTRRLEARGIRVTGEPGMAPAPRGLHPLATIRSAPLASIMRRMNVASSNLRAEVLGKFLGRLRFGRPSIDGAARAIGAFVRARGLAGTSYDASGLSYANRVRSDTMVRLLWYADTQPWADPLRATLPTGGEGTLRGRLERVTLRAKTGTLIDVSALSGWVWLDRAQEWAEFSILSSRFDDDAAKVVEDKIVRIVAHQGADPTP